MKNGLNLASVELRRRLPALLLLVTLCAAYPAEHALAVVECPPHDQPEVEFKRFDLIARGTLTQIKAEDEVVFARFEPSEVFKGTPPDTIQLRYQRPLETEDGGILLLTARPDGTYDYWFCGQHGFSADKPRHAYDVFLTRYRARWTEKLNDVEANPDDIDALLGLAHFLEVSSDRPGAKSTYERIIARWPEDGRGYAGLGRVLIAFDAPEAALVALARALELSPHDSRTLRLLQRARMKLGYEVDYSQVDFRGLTMIKLDLSGQDLTGRDFRGALLSGANFQDALLDGAIFAGATMWGANFSGASMRGADLRYAKFYSARFSKTDLTGARADDTTFLRVEFSYARLMRFSAQRADFHLSRFENTVLGNADLSEASLLDVSFSTVDVSGTIFYGAQLKGVDLSSMDLSNTVLRTAKLTGARYNCSTMFPKKFVVKRHRMVPTERVCGDMVQPLLFRGYDWTGFDFSGLDLSGADFREANLTSAVFNETNLEGANFSGSSLSNAQFYAANLEGADFSNAQLGATYSGANLRNANFSHATIIHDNLLSSGRFRRNQTPVKVGPADVAGAKFNGTTLHIGRYFFPSEHAPNFSRADLSRATIACGEHKFHDTAGEIPSESYRENWQIFQKKLRIISAIATAQQYVRLKRKCAKTISKYSDEGCAPWITADRRPSGCVFPKPKK